MAEHIRVSLDELRAPGGATEIVHTDARFSRVRVRRDAPCPIEVLSDHADPWTFHFLQIDVPAGAVLELAIPGAGTVISNPRVGLIVQAGPALRWLPVAPMQRRWDAQARIVAERTLTPVRRRAGDHLLLRISPTPDAGRVELPVLEASDAGGALLAELVTETAAERRRYSLVRHFDYASIADAWRYLVDGAVYHRGLDFVGRRFRNEQAALTLYELIDGLHGCTGKRIYRALLDEIAYSVMLALDRSGRWRHGILSDDMETHTRLQTDAMLLLLGYHDRTGDSAFLESTRTAMEYLVTIADELEGGGLWFLHDTIELDAGLARSLYHLEASRAFGKTIGNILCLNTHLRTLESLQALHQITGDRRYRDLLVRGVGAARTVLAARPAELPYRLLYGVRAGLDRLAPRPGAGGRPWWSLLDRAERRALKKVKALSPRLVMPNGFIERDLAQSAHSDFYHIQNLKDLLCLHRRQPEAWMLDLVDRGIELAARQEPGRLVDRHRGCSSLLAVLAMYLARRPAAGHLVQHLVDAVCVLGDRAIGMPIDLVTYTWTGDLAGRAGSVDPRLVPIGLGGGRLLVVNPTKEMLDGVPPRQGKVEPRVRPATLNSRQ